MTPTELLAATAKLREARASATAGEWGVCDGVFAGPGSDTYADVLLNGDEARICACEETESIGKPEQQKANADFIALAANTLTPDFLDAVERLARERTGTCRNCGGPVPGHEFCPSTIERRPCEMAETPNEKG